jgi:tetratricopeptide (TPR) repeat protein
MLITYTCTFVLSINLIVDPLLSALGFGSAHWQIALRQGSSQELSTVVLIHATLAIIFIVLISSTSIQKLFAELIRPIAMEKIKKALAENVDKNDLVASCNLVLLYESAGLTKQASKKLAQIKLNQPDALLTKFVEAYLNFRRRNYKQSLKLFSALSDSTFPLGNELKAMFLAAAACSSHALRDYSTALNLVDRALEFDYQCAMARMIKIDIYLKQGKDEKAADEFQTALYGGFDQTIEQTIPIDWEKAIALVRDVDTCNNENIDLSKSANQVPPPV